MVYVSHRDQGKAIVYIQVPIQISIVTFVNTHSFPISGKAQGSGNGHSIHTSTNPYFNSTTSREYQQKNESEGVYTAAIVIYEY